MFPFGILVVPSLVHYWYVTKHQDRAVRAAGGLDPLDQVAVLAPSPTGLT